MPDSLPSIQRIQSSSVDAIGYDPASGKLYVRFIGSGHAYVYRDVPETVYQSLMGAESKGRFVNERIKGAYEYRRL
ncbi:MAG: KTSC domain-containing protein [Gammaproteobacteria bacterium]|nr:KTSC domain-containing protein [Gammaproteobacteria bacterium]